MKLFGFTPLFIAAIFMMMLGSTSLLAIDAQPKVWSFSDGSGIKATNDAAFTSQASIMGDSTMTTAKMFGSGSGLTASREFGSGASTAFMTPQDGLFFKTDTLSSAATPTLSKGQAYLSSASYLVNQGKNLITNSAKYTGASLTTFGSGTALYTTTPHKILGIMGKAEAASYSGYIMTGSVLIFISALAIIGRKEKETADIIVEKEDNHHTMNTEDANDIDNSHTSAFNYFMGKVLSKKSMIKAYSKHHFGRPMSSIISLFHKLGFTNMTHYGGSPALSSSKA